MEPFKKIIDYDMKMKLIDIYYDVLIKLRSKIFIDVLKEYTKLSGTAITDNMMCYFGDEIPEDDKEEFFGYDNDTIHVFYPPTVKEESYVSLSYNEFYQIIENKAEIYIKLYPNDKKIINMLLKELKLVLPI